MSERFKGKVKWFNEEKGYGFIIPDVRGPDVFVHKNALEKSNIPGLMEGQEIEYSVDHGKKPGDKPRACDLKTF